MPSVSGKRLSSSSEPKRLRVVAQARPSPLARRGVEAAIAKPFTSGAGQVKGTLTIPTSDRPVQPVLHGGRPPEAAVDEPELVAASSRSVKSRRGDPH